MSSTANETTSSSNAHPSISSPFHDFVNKISGSTPSIQAIEGRYSAAGGSAHHTPGHGHQNNERGGMSAKANTTNAANATAVGAGAGAADKRPEPSAVGQMVSNLLNGGNGAASK